MERMKIAARPRTTTEKADDVRAEGRVPGVVYGGTRTGSTSLSFGRSELLAVYRKTRPSTVIDLDIDGATVPVLMVEVQRNPLNEELMHVDFRQVDGGSPVRSSVAITFVGEAPAIKTLGGVLSVSRTKLKVKAMPDQLIDTVTVDLSKLKGFTDVVKVGDIALPEGVVCVDHEQSVVVRVRPPRREVKVEADAAVTSAAPAAEPAKA